VSQNIRSYHLHVLRPEGVDSLVLEGWRLVKYRKEHLGIRRGGKKSKAQRILEYLRKHRDQAFSSKNVAEALKAYGVKVREEGACLRLRLQDGRSANTI